ncbi:MAG TPA: hypothetical protein VEQ10_06520, partial [Vicinamibacteria bacterium]|nr:hypothetical protein [Vicinamibacteria bacterium]
MPAGWRVRLRPQTLAAAGLLLLVVLLFRQPLLQGGVVYERDVHLIWHPQVEGFVRAVAGGALPLWDPSPAFGQPLLADPGAQVLYPPTWLNLLMRPWTYYTLFAAGHLALSALAFFALARRWVSVAAAATGAAVWALCGPLLSMVTLWHHYAGACLAPLVLLAAERAAATRRAREVVLLGLAIGLQMLAGSADMCALTLVTVAAWTAMVHVRWRQPREIPWLLGGGAVALLLAAALAAGQWVASLELLTRSSRRELPEAVRTYWSVHPASLLGTIAVGVPVGLPLQAHWRQELFEGREPFMGSLYLGLPALGLVAAGLFRDGQRRRGLALAAVLATAVLMALGRHAPAYAALTWLVPPLRVLRYPVKTMVFAALAWSGLVALGVDGWRSALSGRRHLAALLPLTLATALVAALAAAMLADVPALRAAAGRLLVPEHLLAMLPVGRALALHALLGAALAALAWRFPGGSRAACAAAVLAVLDLALAHPVPTPVAPSALYAHRPEVLAALEPLAKARVYSYDYGEIGRAQAWGGGTPHVLARQPAGWSLGASTALALQLGLAPQTAGRWGLRQGFDIDYRGLQAQPVALFTRLVRVDEADPDAVLRLLQLASVTHVIALHPFAADRLPLAAELPGLFRHPIRVEVVPGSLPRVRVVAGVRAADDDAALGALVDPKFDPGRAVVLARGPAREAPAAFDGRARIVSEAADALRVEAELSSAGYLVIADSYDQGWKAAVDGVRAPLLRANLAFRAVPVPAGRHQVEL